MAGPDDAYLVATTGADAFAVSPDGEILAAWLDSLRVDQNWLKDVHIAWFSGEALGLGPHWSLLDFCA